MSTVNTTEPRQNRSFQWNSLVHVEENEPVETAIRELEQKFQIIPHFDRLPYIFGVAINARHISFGKITMRDYIVSSVDLLWMEMSKGCNVSQWY